MARYFQRLAAIAFLIATVAPAWSAEGTNQNVIDGTGLAPTALNPVEAIIADGNQEMPMRFIAPKTRIQARALGIGGYAKYMVLGGSRAMQRVANTQPTFLLSIPDTPQPKNYYTLASFAVRPNNTREVVIASTANFGGYSAGVTGDRVMPTSVERLADQSNAPNGFTIYKISTTKPLAPGEYALIVYNSPVKTRVLGSSGFFAPSMDTCFDFGIDR